MSNPSKARGTAAETAVVAYLRPWFPNVERRALSGTNDRGDVAGVPRTCIEVKACKALDLAGWVDESAVEAVNAGADYGIVWAKRRGKSSPADWYVVMTGATFVELLRADA